jgi:uncharacterized protein YndB with AHSA1/START domain
MVLVVSRLIRATPERLFDAWTSAAELVKWWGPEAVTCVGAEVDLRVGGSYRIGNRFPDGTVLWIAGEFELIERPQRLAYTWRIEPAQGADERVLVTFTTRGADTEVSVRHERIGDEARRRRHEQGWHGCLAGLAQYAHNG